MKGTGGVRRTSSRPPAPQDLPDPLLGRSGWPWTVATPDQASFSSSLPRITVVTPSYNQGQFIEETIRSVLLQGYPNLEYMVVDGASTDDSVSMIERYAPWLDYWCSEPDRGQSHALNKGFSRSTGDVLAWLNSDDLYCPGLLWRVAAAYLRSSGERFWYITGVEYRDQESGTAEVSFQEEWFHIDDWVTGQAQLHQQGAFWSRRLWQDAGPFDESMHLGFDKEFFTHLVALGYKYEVDREFVGATYRQHSACKWKTSNNLFQHDWARVSLRYLRPDHPGRRRVRRALSAKIAYFQLRMAQDFRRPQSQRVRHLAAAIRHQPSLLLSRVFLGSLRLLLVRRSRP